MRDPDGFQLTLIDPIAGLCSAWAEEFAQVDAVEIVNGRFEDVDAYDCIVSPANSFGLMDGGVDLAIVEFFGIELMDRVQRLILERYRGEQPVGTSIIVETGDSKHPYLAHTPTMRVPMSISGTDHVYCAMWAMLVAVWRHNVDGYRAIESVLCPGLGTLTGQVEYSEAARQMALAYRNFVDPPSSMSWPHARWRQRSIGLARQDISEH